MGDQNGEGKSLACHWNINEPTDTDELAAWRAVETEWRRQRRETGNHLKWWRVTSIVPPAAAAVATVLAATDWSTWAVIPAAIATATSGAAASFTFRSSFAKHKDLGSSIAFEALGFATATGAYNNTDSKERITTLLARVRALSESS